MRFEPVYIATSIIVCAFGGFLWSSWGIAQLNWEGSWLLALKIFHHGCEGALVGGICDFIAVHNVYDAARREFPALRDNTAKVVIKDMIHLQAEIKQAAQLDILLHDPEKQEAFIDFIREFIPEKKRVQALAEDLWHNHVRAEIVHFLAEAEISTGRTDTQNRNNIDLAVFKSVGAMLLNNIAAEEEENRALVDKMRALSQDVTLAELGIPADAQKVQELLSAIWMQWQESGSFEERPLFGIGKISTFAIKALSPRIASVVQNTSLLQAISPLLSEQSVKQGLESFARKLEEENEVLDNSTADLFDDIVNYWAVFARAWNNLPMAERTAVLSEVLCILEEELLQWCIDSIWNIRNQLLRPSVLLEKQFSQNLIAALSEQINNRAEMVEDKALFALQSKFDEMGADGFVGMLRSRTKRQLDWIKVNGSVWGFVLGAIAGGLALLF